MAKFAERSKVWHQPNRPSRFVIVVNVPNEDPLVKSFANLRRTATSSARSAWAVQVQACPFLCPQSR